MCVCLTLSVYQWVWVLWFCVIFAVCVCDTWAEGPRGCAVSAWLACVHPKGQSVAVVGAAPSPPAPRAMSYAYLFKYIIIGDTGACASGPVPAAPARVLLREFTPSHARVHRWPDVPPFPLHGAPLRISHSFCSVRAIPCAAARGCAPVSSCCHASRVRSHRLLCVPPLLRPHVCLPPCVKCRVLLVAVLPYACACMPLFVV